MISYADTACFTPDRCDTRANATAVAKPAPKPIRHAISQMPDNTEIEKRDRALIAFTFLTGPPRRRDRVATAQARRRRTAPRFAGWSRRYTKGGKTIETWFFPVGEEIERIVVEWVHDLETEKLFGGDDLLFPRTNVEVSGTGDIDASGFGRDPWRTAERVRKVFWAAFEHAGLQSFNPHSFRHALARLGKAVCRTPEGSKAWSQNLGREKMLTTFYSYGKVEPHRQGELIRGLRQRGSVNQTESTEHLIDALLNLLSTSKKDIS